MPSTVFVGKVYEDCQATLIGRFTALTGTGAASPVTEEGNLILQADVSSITVSAWDNDGTQIGTTQTPTAAATVFDTLQTTLTWGNLNQGGNVRYTCPASFFPSGGQVVRIEMLITLTDGSKLPGLWDATVEGLRQS